ncbi:MAG TPA: carboxylate--amine ligase [Blastocatellia bacterium]|nr:carboxylate--amine ligase [Blastocatellia bacterium]
MMMIDDAKDLTGAIRGAILPEQPPAAVVFNCHITGLAVARSLGRQGVPVIGLDRDSRGYGLYSRYLTVAGKCPYPLDDEAGFIDVLMEIGAALPRKGVLFPCLDEWVFAVARHRKTLEEFYLMPFSELPVIERILDKNLLYRKCEEMGTPIPGTYYLDQESPERIASQITFPCIVKPALQREFTNEFGEKVFRAENRGQFLEMCERAGRHPLLAQEIVGAGVDSFYSLCSYMGRDGQPKGLFVGRKLEQYPPDFGTACLVDSRFVGAIAERGIEILKQFGYQGISEVEFILDERDGDFKLLDINTRVWKWIGLPIRSGVDLPWLAYVDAVSGKVESAPRQVDGLKWVYLKDYLALAKARRLPPNSLLTHQEWTALASGAGDSAATIVPAVLSADDPGPFIRLMENLFETGQYYCAC